MPFGGLLIGGIGALASAGIGAANGSSDRSAAAAAHQAALQNYLNVNVPDPAQQKLILEKYQQTGQLDPAMEQAINAGPTAQQGIALDPGTRAAQEAALSKLSDITSNNGMDAQEKNQIQMGINQTNANTKGQTDAILQNAAARGVGGSGASLAAELQAGQSGANAASEQAMNAQSMASQRALSALSQQGAQAGAIHSQDYGQALNSANATDAINQFNTRNQNAAMQANTAAQNQAQQYNVQERQNLANQNTGLSNYQQQYNSQLGQQNFNNQMSKANAQANAQNGVANQANYSANTTANQWGNIGAAIAGGATAIANRPASADPNAGSGKISSTTVQGADPSQIAYDPEQDPRKLNA